MKKSKPTTTPITAAPAQGLSGQQQVFLIVKTIGLGFFIFLGAQILGAVFISLIGLSVGATEQSIADAITNNDAVRLATIFTIEAITVWFIFTFLRRNKQTFKDIYVSKKPTKKHALEAVKSYALYFVLFLGILTIVGVLGLIDTNQAQELGFKNPTGINLVYAFLALVVLPPFVEELLFRGFLLKRLTTVTSVHISAFIVSILFGAAHLEFGNGGPLNWAAGLDTFILSYVLVYVTVRTKSLWPAIFVHVFKNGLAFATLFLIK